MKKKQIILTQDEMQDACDIHKKMMEAMGEKAYKHKKEKQFEIEAMAIALSISGMMAGFGIRGNIKEFVDDLSAFVIQIHPEAVKNQKFIRYDKGKKVEKGSFQ